MAAMPKPNAGSVQIAVARKLAVLMHQLWMDSGEFRWSDKEAVA